MKMTRAVIPNFFTVLNMVCGFTSMVHATNQEFDNAAWFIIFGGLFDALDGFMARLTNSSSDFGVELDSLSDVISFGVAPSFLVYHFGLNEYGVTGFLVATSIMIAGSLRLARFNIQLVGYDKNVFKGLPIPGQAVMICSFILSYPFLSSHLQFDKNLVLLSLTILLSILMVSNITYPTIPKFSVSDIKSNPVRFGLFVFFIIIILLFREYGLFAGMLVYVLFGLFRALINLLKPGNGNSIRYMH